MSLHTLTVAELAAGLKARQFSSLELALHFLGRIERLGPGLNAFVTVTADRALDDARRADEQLAKGEGGPLTGVPIALAQTSKGHNARRETTASLDRIDSSGPYSLDNCQWLHRDVNAAKQRFSMQRFILLCALVAQLHADPNLILLNAAERLLSDETF